MKVFLTLFVFLLFCLAATAQNKTNREQAQLEGKVKTLEAYRIVFSWKDGKIEQSKRIRWFIHTFNPEGDFTERTTFDHLGNILERIVYNFDKEGRKIGYDEYHTIKGQLITVPRKHIYALDDRGNRIEYKVFESDGNPAGRFTYKYDSKGNKIEDGYYYYTGIFGGRTLYTYDEKGNQTSQISYGQGEAVNWKIILKYDSLGQMVEQLQYSGETLKYKIVNKYDDKRRVVETETIEFNATGNAPTHSPVPGKVIYTYDDRERTKETARYLPDGALAEKVLFTFDGRGNEIERLMFKADGSPESSNTSTTGTKPLGTLIGKWVTKYEFDSQGNWTKKQFWFRRKKLPNLEPIMPRSA